MSKVTDYAAITNVQSDDLLLVVDIHDTSMAATGTDKKMTLSQLAIPVIDATAADIQPDGVQAAGATGKAADAGHVHPHQPWQFLPQSYGAKGDGKVITDVVITSGSPTLTSASAAFTSADTGKTMLVAGGSGSHVPLVVTITFVSATTVTMSGNAGASFTSGAPTQAVYGTDDTAAINSAYQAAIAYAAGHGQYAEVTGPPLIYMLAAATTKTVSNGLHYNAQIPLTPTNTASSQQPQVAFRFGAGGIASPMFAAQTVPQTGSGAVFVSTLTGLTVDATFGAPSVIGGPTDGTESSSAATWNSMAVLVEGLSVVVPLNPTIIGLDFRGMAKASVPRYGAMPFDTIGNISSVAPAHSWATGLFMPVELNNDEAFIGEVLAIGFYYGHSVFAHTSAQTIKSLYCGYGLFVGGNGNDKHGLAINYASLEACGTGIQCDGNSGITVPVNVGMCDIESVGFFAGFGSNHIQDPNNGLGGHITINDNAVASTALSISGGGNCEIIAANQARGPVASPTAPPASGSAWVNTYWRHAWITLHMSAGSITALSIDSVAQTPGTVSTYAFLLPSGHSYTPTYSGGTLSHTVTLL